VSLCGPPCLCGEYRSASPQRHRESQSYAEKYLIPRYASITFGSFLISSGHAERNRFSVIHDLNALADAHDDFHICARPAGLSAKAVADLLDRAIKIFLLGRIQTGGRLVQQQELGSRGQGPNNFQTPLFTVRQAGPAFVPEIRQLENLQQIEREFAVLAFVTFRTVASAPRRRTDFWRA